MILFNSVRNFGQSVTETKVKLATDENENAGATGTLMNEISILTYNVKTLKEIVTVLKKRLTGYGRKSSHKNCIHILKTLTLISYLINNGSNDFVSWMRSNLVLFEVLKLFEAQNADDMKIEEQIRSICESLCVLINDDDLLEQRRKDVIHFRSSISTPGRKSIDNSHLKKSQTVIVKDVLSKRSKLNKLTSLRSASGPEPINEFQFNSTSSGTTSVELLNNRTDPIRRNTHDFAQFKLESLEEETIAQENGNNVEFSIYQHQQTEISQGFSMNNPFK